MSPTNVLTSESKDIHQISTSLQAIQGLLKIVVDASLTYLVATDDKLATCTKSLSAIDKSLASIADSQRQLAASVKEYVDVSQGRPGAPASAAIVLGSPVLSPPHQQEHHPMRKCVNASKAAGGRMKAGPPLDFPQLASDGASLQVYDSAGNVVAAGIDHAKATTAWTSSDPTIVTVTPDNTDDQKATLKSTGKAGSITITATFASLDGSPALPPAVSDPISVGAGPPASASIVLGVPTP